MVVAGFVANRSWVKDLRCNLLSSAIKAVKTTELPAVNSSNVAFEKLFLEEKTARVTFLRKQKIEHLRLGGVIRRLHATTQMPLNESIRRSAVVSAEMARLEVQNMCTVDTPDIDQTELDQMAIDMVHSALVACNKEMQEEIFWHNVRQVKVVEQSMRLELVQEIMMEQKKLHWQLHEQEANMWEAWAINQKVWIVDRTT